VQQLLSSLLSNKFRHRSLFAAWKNSPSQCLGLWHEILHQIEYRWQRLAHLPDIFPKKTLNILSHCSLPISMAL